MSAQASGHAAHPETKVSSGDVLLWPVGGGDCGLFRIDRHEDTPIRWVQWKLDITSLRTFNNREEAILYADSQGIRFREIPFKPDYWDIWWNGEIHSDGDER